MALINSQYILEAGSIPVPTTPTTLSNTFVNGGTEFIVITALTEAVSIKVLPIFTTIDLQSYGDLDKPEPTLTLAARQTGYIGPFPPGAYSGTDSQATFELTTTSCLITILTF